MTLMTEDSTLQNDQVKAIEQTKLTVKKRKGVVPFIRVFPVSGSDVICDCYQAH